MKRLHLALSTRDIEASVPDYSRRLGVAPCVHVAGEYALWRTPTLNLSVRQDTDAEGCALRHLGWEDPATPAFMVEPDANGILWETFTAEQQGEEINALWPGTHYRPA